MLVFIGFLVVLVAIISTFSSAGDEEKARGGSVIIIGPLPIVFGTDRKSVKALLLLSIILMVLAVIGHIVLNYL